MNEQNIAARAATRYAVAYGGEWDDYYQEACLAMLMARRCYDSRKGAWAAYAARAVYRWLYGYAEKTRSPVSGSAHRIDELRRAHRASPQARITTRALGPESNGPARAATPEDAAADDEWLARVRARVRDVLAEDPDHDAARLYLVHGWRLAEVARSCRCTPSRVRRAARRCRTMLREDPELNALVAEAWR